MIICDLSSYGFGWIVTNLGHMHSSCFVRTSFPRLSAEVREGDAEIPPQRGLFVLNRNQLYVRIRKDVISGYIRMFDDFCWMAR